LRRPITRVRKLYFKRSVGASATVYNSTYSAEYVSDTQSMLLTDTVSGVDVVGMEFLAFRRMNRMIFGESVALKIETAVCGYESVIINWKQKRVAVKKHNVDLAEEFMKRALNPETIEDRLHIAAGDMNDELKEFDRALMGISDVGQWRQL
jgi:hypothetical protein